jgi:hypothetical protein
MKSLLAILTFVFISASAAVAGDDCCNKAAAAKTCETACAKAKGTECSKKAECPKAAAALRAKLLTHKGSLLAVR